MDYKEEIYKKLKEYLEKNDINLEEKEIYGMINKGNEKIGSDISIACFRLAKDLKKAPNQIAEDIINDIKEIPNVAKMEATGPYINIFLNRENYSKNVLENVRNIDLVQKENIGKTVILDYSSPNIAKEFHVGHLKTTVVGAAFRNIFRALGYNALGDNHLGDYGTQFGKLVEGYNLWKDEYTFENPIKDLTDIYVRINALIEKDEEAKKIAIDNFKKLEEGNEEVTRIWKKFVDLSLKEFNRIYDYLGVTFDMYKGEASYSKDMPKVVEMLKEKGLLKESNGLQIVDLEDDGLGIVVIQKGNGSSMYVTRDIATFLYRIEEFDFDKALYVVGSEQIQYFKQVFKIMEKMGVDKKYIDGAKHIAYGLISLPEGKMSTRRGNVIKVEALLKEAIKRVKEKLDEKDDLTEEEKEKIAKQVGIGAVKFSNLSNQLIKDQVFVWDNVLDYAGDSGPYVQYTNARIQSVLREYSSRYENEKGILNNLNDVLENLDKNNFENEYVFNLVKKLSEFKDVVIETAKKYETYILTNYLIELSKSFNQYYNNNKILIDDEDKRKLGIILCESTSNVLTRGMELLGIEMPDKM